MNSNIGYRVFLSTLCASAILAAGAAASAGVLPVPYDSQDNLTTTCGSCGSASTGMALAYLGQKNAANDVEAWLYAGLECGPGPASLVSRANEYCSSHGLASPCATYYDWSSGDAWANLVAEIDAGRPFVAHVYQYGYSHYVLVTGYGDGQVYLNDPVPSHVGWRSWGEFNGQWANKSYDGVRFLLAPPVLEDPVADELLYQAEVFHPSTTTDIDGDGKADVCARGTGEFWCYTSKATRFDTLVSGPTDLADGVGWNDPANYTTLRMGDINGDGLADLCGRYDAGISCFLSTGTGFGPNFPGPTLSDDQGWNGVEYFTTLQLADFDGDGKDDLCARGTAGFRCWRSKGSGFEEPPILLNEMLDEGGWNQRQYYGTIRMGDLNGDGKADVCGRGIGGIRCWLSTGTGFSPEIAGPPWSDDQGWGGNNYQYWSTIRLADIDGDRKDDICARAGKGIVCFKSTGTGFGPEIQGPPWSDSEGWADRIYFSTIRFADFNGDGKKDLFARGTAGVFVMASDGNSFAQVAHFPDFSDGSGWTHPEYYRTFRVGDLEATGAVNLCARFASGFRCSQGTAFTGLDEFGDSGGWNKALYYPSLRFAGGHKPVVVPPGTGGSAGAGGNTEAGGSGGASVAGSGGATEPTAGSAGQSSDAGGSAQGGAGSKSSFDSNGSTDESGCNCSIIESRSRIDPTLTWATLMSLFALRRRVRSLPKRR